jgi:uncharacterized protein (DUF2252 family)
MEPMNPISSTERLQAGRSLRKKVPRAAHASWTPTADRPDPIKIIVDSSQGRLPELIPIRYGRMLQSPFTFLRGSAALMAYDLAGTPTTRVEVQACGDCHLLNFGLFGTPERNLIFDIRDMDETLRAPWEWELKRLAASLVVAGRMNGIGDRRLSDVAAKCAHSYQQHMREFSEMSPLEVWYFRVSAQDLIEDAPDAKSREIREQMAEKARGRSGQHLFPKITEEKDGRHHFVEQPPLITRMSDDASQKMVEVAIEDYRASLPDDRRFVFDRYWLEDFALRVVGIGSVGTRCYVGLFFCDDKHPLLLQVKEARPSVLEPYAAKSPFDNEGQRVVVGKRLMQSASDIFLGWFRGRTGHDFYVRQLRDMKFVFPVDGFTALQFERYADSCGWTLARAHARSGDSATITGYLGEGDKFESALAKFALAYADQTESDYALLVEAARSGRVEARVEEEP